MRLSMIFQIRSTESTNALEIKKVVVYCAANVKQILLCIIAVIISPVVKLMIVVTWAGFISFYWNYYL
jgi:hypothetical protein